jgi:hypothetical protein
LKAAKAAKAAKTAKAATAFEVGKVAKAANCHSRPLSLVLAAFRPVITHGRGGEMKMMKRANALFIIFISRSDLCRVGGLKGCHRRD